MWNRLQTRPSPVPGFGQNWFFPFFLNNLNGWNSSFVYLNWVRERELVYPYFRQAQMPPLLLLGENFCFLRKFLLFEKFSALFLSFLLLQNLACLDLIWLFFTDEEINFEWYFRSLLLQIASRPCRHQNRQDSTIELIDLGIDYL